MRLYRRNNSKIDKDKSRTREGGDTMINIKRNQGISKWVRLGVFMVFAATLLFMTGCANQTGEDTTELGNEKLTVMTTLFPQYDFVKQIAGDKVNVQLLLPPGVEAHAYEPTPHDMVAIQKSDMFIYTSEEMEPWAHKVIETVGEDHVIVVEAGTGLFETEHDDHDHDADEHDDHDHDADEHDDHDHDADEHDDHDHDADEHDDHDHDADEHGHDHDGADPHIWLDPIKAKGMVENIKAGLVEALPQEADTFEKNAQAYLNELDKLHERTLDVVAHLESKTIVSGGHFAFGHFIERYGLEYKSPYVGFAPDAEPTPKRIAELIDFINDADVRAIFYEELVDPRVATVISDETDADMLMLHAAHNVSKDELEAGVTYIEIMNSNLENLKQGLGYKEGE